MLTRNLIRVAEETSNRAHKAVHETFAMRDENQEAWQAWKDACASAREITLPTDYLWSDETRHRIKEGDREHIDDALLFLQTDPWFDGSGYLKEQLLDSLRQAPLTEEDKTRIQEMLIRMAAGRNCREFSRWCSLAVKVTTDEFERELDKLAKERDAECAGKFSFLLQYIRKHRHDY